MYVPIALDELRALRELLAPRNPGDHISIAVLRHKVDSWIEQYPTAMERKKEKERLYKDLYTHTHPRDGGTVIDITPSRASTGRITSLESNLEIRHRKG